MRPYPTYQKLGFNALALIFLSGVAGVVMLLVAPAAVAFAQESTECEQCAAGRQGLATLMNGDPDGATKFFQEIEVQDPGSPLGYLLDADATWWKIYLTTANFIDPDVFDVVYAKSSPYDSHFQDLVGIAIQKAEARVAANQQVERSELYEGMAYALRARFFGLRDSDLPTARAAKKMRSLLLAAVQSDPKLADADAGLGLYNYFVDTLPGIVKMLKFMIGLPGGSREVGLQQLQHAAEEGDLVRAEAKFYLAKDFSRWNEKQYARSLQLFHELSQEYPHNMLWKLLTGSVEIRLGRTGEGESVYREVLAKSSGGNSEIQKAFHHAAQEALQRQHPGEKIE